jgi:hypothetical protein
MWKDGLIPPVFSLAISRPSSNLLLPDGYLAFGGLPPVGGTGPYASTPIQSVNVATWYIPGSLPQPQNGKYCIQVPSFSKLTLDTEFYVITPDELLYKGPSATQWSSDPGNGTTQIQAIVYSLPSPLKMTLTSPDRCRIHPLLLSPLHCLHARITLLTPGRLEPFPLRLFSPLHGNCTELRHQNQRRRLPNRSTRYGDR